MKNAFLVLLLALGAFLQPVHSAGTEERTAAEICAIAAVGGQTLGQNEQQLRWDMVTLLCELTGMTTTPDDKVWVELLCDDNGAFYRCYNQDGTTSVVTTADLDLLGAAYIPVGTVGNCGVDDSELILLCDDDAGTVIEFLRRVVIDASGNVSITDTTLDAVTPYAAVGTVGKCGDIDVEQQVLCDTVTTGGGESEGHILALGPNASNELRLYEYDIDTETETVIGDVAGVPFINNSDRRIATRAPTQGNFFYFQTSGAPNDQEWNVGEPWHEINIATQTVVNSGTADVSVGVGMGGIGWVAGKIYGFQGVSKELYTWNPLTNIWDGTGVFLNTVVSTLAGRIDLDGDHLGFLYVYDQDDNFAIKRYNPVIGDASLTLMANLTHTVNRGGFATTNDPQDIGNGSGILFATGIAPNGRTALNLNDGSVISTSAVAYQRIIAGQILPDPLETTATRFMRHYVYDDGVSTGQFDTELDGVTPYLITGDVTECEVTRSTIQVMCDNTIQFIRRIDYVDNTPIVLDYQIDGVTSYQVTGDVGLCRDMDTEQRLFCDKLTQGANDLFAGTVVITRSNGGNMELYGYDPVSDSTNIPQTLIAGVPHPGNTFHKHTTRSNNPGKFYHFSSVGGAADLSHQPGELWYEIDAVNLTGTAGTAAGASVGNGIIGVGNVKGVIYGLENVTNMLKTFDPGTNTWTDTGVTLATLPAGPTTAMDGSDDGFLYFVIAGTPTQEIRRYDPLVGDASLTVIGNFTLVNSEREGFVWTPDYQKLGNGSGSGLLIASRREAGSTSFEIRNANDGTIVVDDPAGYPHSLNGNIAAVVDPAPFSAADIKFLRHYVYEPASGSVTFVYDTKLDGVTLYEPQGLIDDCEGSSAMVETQLLCDDDGLGSKTPFLRRFQYDVDGTATVSDWGLDGTTPYTVTGTVGKCSDDLDKTWVQILCDEVSLPGDFLGAVQLYDTASDTWYSLNVTDCVAGANSTDYSQTGLQIMDATRSRAGDEYLVLSGNGPPHAVGDPIETFAIGSGGIVSSVNRSGGGSNAFGIAYVGGAVDTYFVGTNTVGSNMRLFVLNELTGSLTLSGVDITGGFSTGNGPYPITGDNAGMLYGIKDSGNIYSFSPTVTGPGTVIANVGNARGIVWNPANDHLYVMGGNTGNETLTELDTSGAIINGPCAINGIVSGAIFDLRTMVPTVEALDSQQTAGTTTTQFQRCFTSDSAGVVTFVDLDFDGAAYVIQGTVTECDLTTTATEFDLLEFCDVVTITHDLGAIFSVGGTPFASPSTGGAPADFTASSSADVQFDVGRLTIDPNDPLASIIYDLGNGQKSDGLNQAFIFDTSSYPDGYYIAAIIYTFESGNQVVVKAQYEVSGGLIISVNVFDAPGYPQSYSASVGKAYQSYNAETGAFNAGPFNADGSAYTPTGTLTLDCPSISTAYVCSQPVGSSTNKTWTELLCDEVIVPGDVIGQILFTDTTINGIAQAWNSTDDLGAANDISHGLNAPNLGTRGLVTDSILVFEGSAAAEDRITNGDSYVYADAGGIIISGTASGLDGTGNGAMFGIGNVNGTFYGINILSEIWTFDINTGVWTDSGVTVSGIGGTNNQKHLDGGTDGFLYVADNGGVVQINPLVGGAGTPVAGLPGAGTHGIAVSAEDDLFYRRDALGTAIEVYQISTGTLLYSANAGASQGDLLAAINSVDAQPVASTTSTTFQRCFTSDSAGVVSFVDLDFDGAAYTVQGTVTECSTSTATADQFETEQLILCDQIATVTAETGQLQFINNAGVIEAHRVDNDSDAPNGYGGTALVGVNQLASRSPNSPNLILFDSLNGSFDVGEAWEEMDNTGTIVNSGTNTTAVSFSGVFVTNGVLYLYTGASLWTLDPDTGTFTDTGNAFTGVTGTINQGAFTGDENGNAYFFNAAASTGLIFDPLVGGAGTALASGFSASNLQRGLVWSPDTGGLGTGSGILIGGPNNSNLQVRNAADGSFIKDLVLANFTAGIRAVAGAVTLDANPGAGTPINNKFVRHTTYEGATGAVLNTFDTELDMGTPYAVQGTVGECVEPKQWTMLLCDDDGNGTLVEFIRCFETDTSGNTTVTDTTLDGATPYTVTGTAVKCQNLHILEAYIKECDEFDIVLPINQPAEFGDNAGTETTIAISASGISALIFAQMDEAKEYQRQQEQNSLPVTDVVIETSVGTQFTFPPSAVISVSGQTLILDSAQLTSWPGAESSVFETISYSVFSNCNCRPVEMVQSVSANGNSRLLTVLDTRDTDFATGQKPVVAMPTFGISGPFPGPCPADEQVIAIDELCCNNDLQNGEPTVAAQRQAWVDASDTTNMYDQRVGGSNVPFGGQVFRIEDKLSPGVAPSVIVPNNVGVDSTADGPTLVDAAVNGLPALVFDGTDDRLRLDTGAAPGSSFTGFWLVATPDQATSQACVMSVGAANSDGDNFFPNSFSWQISRDTLFNSFVFRMNDGGSAGAPTINFQKYPGPDDGFGGVNSDFGIQTWDYFADGGLHLVTGTFDSPTFTLTFFVDGERTLELDLSTMDVGTNTLAGDYFRFFGNRAGNSFLNGTLAEVFFADSLMADNDIATVNAYLICKWGVDPSLAAGGAGDLTLAANGAYTSPTPFRRIKRADGTTVYTNLNNGLEFPLPPVPGLSVCPDETAREFWVCHLIDNATTPFQRRFVRDAFGQVTFEDLDLNGNSYTPTGPITFP